MLARLRCFLRHTHDYQLRRQPGRLFLECAHCGHCSPGWVVAKKPGPLPAEPFHVLFDDFSIARVSEERGHRIGRTHPPMPGEFRLNLEPGVPEVADIRRRQHYRHRRGGKDVAKRFY